MFWTDWAEVLVLLPVGSWPRGSGSGRLLPPVQVPSEGQSGLQVLFRVVLWFYWSAVNNRARRFWPAPLASLPAGYSSRVQTCFQLSAGFSWRLWTHRDLLVLRSGTELTTQKHQRLKSDFLLRAEIWCLLKIIFLLHFFKLNFFIKYIFLN